LIGIDANLVRFWHRDALRSIVAVSGKDGEVQERMSFDPWGRRQRDTGVVDASVNPSRGDRSWPVKESAIVSTPFRRWRREGGLA
jgi:hypothetical protein